MLLTTASMRTWIYFGFIFGWAAGARPQFDSSTNMGLVLVPADAEVDSVIFRLRATDQDADFPLVFDITAAVQPIVRIENLPCTLYNKVCQANVILTRRLVPGRLHDFAVRVRDSKGDLNSMQATISVTNATTSRDMIFPHIPSIIMVPEDTKPGKELDYLLVRANPWHGKPVYIELWQPKELFTIRQRQTPSQTRGVITLIGELDFETQSMYTLTMYATDPWTEVGKDTRNIAGVHVVVIVQDVQDVPPVFTIAPPLTRINNSVKPGDVIMRVHAEDGDKGTPREVTYGLVSEGNPFTPFFNISEWTGEIILARPLEELTQITHVGAPILLTVVAEEVRRSQEEPPAQATVVELGLLLGEPGNSPPYFESDSYVAYMDENAAPGTVVTFDKPYLTKVRDEDIGKTGVFALKLGNNNGTFEIMPTVAERSSDFVVTVRDNVLMDYEARKSLQFTIIAQEIGPATNLSATVPVTVFLRDVNDNPPKFEKDVYEVTLVENVSPGTRVVQVHASDNDTGSSGSVLYTRIIGPGSESLTMNPETGLIVVASSSTGLDREVTKSLNLSVEATDENGRGLRSTVPLIVNLLDVNDNAPVFDKSIYEFVLNSDRTNFTSPAFIRAVDADAEPPNNEVRYELVHGNYENKFYLNEITGELVLKEPLSKSRRRRNNAYVNFATKFRSNFMNTLDTFRKIRATTDRPLKIWKNRKKRASDDVLYVLTVRAYDMGVPHRSSTAEVHIVTAAPMGALTLMLVVPAEHLDPARTTATLAAITGGRVTIQEIRPYDQPGPQKNGTNHGGKMSLVVARVEPTSSGTFLVDVEKIHKSLVANGMDIVPVVDSNGNSAAGGVVAGTAGESVETPITGNNAGTLGAGAGSTVVGNGANGTGSAIAGVNSGGGKTTGNSGGSGTDGGINGAKEDAGGGVIGKEIDGGTVENKGGSSGIDVDDSKKGSSEGKAGSSEDEGKGTSGESTVVGIPVNSAGSTSGSSAGGTGGNISGGGTSDGTSGGQSSGSVGGSGVVISPGGTTGNTASDGGGDDVKGTGGTTGNVGGVVNAGGTGVIAVGNPGGKTEDSKGGETGVSTGRVLVGGTALGGNTASVNGNVNINEINRTSSTTDNEYIVYKAENKLLLWLLILLGLLMLLALLGLILCCICPGCPFYMAPRKRRIHSFESANYQDGRPKRHLRRKQANVVNAEWSAKKQAWSADPTRRNWQFNRRNTKNRGIASLPGDVAVIKTPQEFQNAPSLRLRDGPASWSVQYANQKRQELDRLYVEDVEAGRPYDIEDIDSLRRHEMERGSDIPRQNYQQGDETSRLPREQHYYRDGNAEVLRLVTRGRDEADDLSSRADRPIALVTDQQPLGYRSDGKDILLRRFIEDQKMRQQHDIHGSIQEICADGLEPRVQGGEQFMQKHEVILMPGNLERDQRQHHEARSPSIQRLIIDHGEEELKAQNQQLGVHETELQHRRKMAAAMLVSTAVTKATEKPLTKIIGHSGSSLNVSSTYASRDIELARQNVLLTQLLMDRDVKHIGVPGLDPGSYLETQSLPGQVAIATQTDRTASTQTDHYIHVRSRSDNDESEDEIRSRKKSKSKKRFGSEIRRSRSIWARSPIQEESKSFSETRSSLLRRKAKEGRDGRRATLEPDVLREISDSLEEQVSSPSPEGTSPDDTQRRTTKDADYKGKKGGDSNEDEEKQPNDIPPQSSPEMSKDRYHRRSHENTGIGDAIRGRGLGSSTRKQQSPSRSKTRSQKGETKSTESKKVVQAQSEKKESDTTASDTKTSTKKRVIESRSSNGETDSKKESDDKKKKQTKLLSKAGLLKLVSEKSNKKNKNRDKEEAPVTKKRLLLRHQKAKKVSTESSEFDELPSKSRQLNVKTKPAKQAESTSDVNLKQDPVKSKGTSSLSDEKKSRSSESDHDRLEKQYQRLSDSTSSTGTTRRQDTVKDKAKTITASEVEEKKEAVEEKNKTGRDSHGEPSQLTTQLKQQLIDLPTAIVMNDKFEGGDSHIPGEVEKASEATSDNFEGKQEEPRSEILTGVLKSSAILIESQLKPITQGVMKISEKLDEATSNVISEPVKSSEVGVSAEKADSDIEKSSKTDQSILEKPREVDTETPESMTDILSIKTQPESSAEEIPKTVQKMSHSLEEKSMMESPKEDSKPLKLSEIHASTEKEIADQNNEKVLTKDSTILVKSEEINTEAIENAANTLPVETQPEPDTDKVSEISEKIAENLEERKTELVSDVLTDVDKAILLTEKNLEPIAKETTEDSEKILNESEKKDHDVAELRTMNILSEEKQPVQSVSEILLKGENIQGKSEEQPDVDSKATRVETETLSEDMQSGPSAKEATQMFLQSESVHSSRDLQVADEKAEDLTAPRIEKSVTPDRSDARQQETQSKDVQDSRDPPTNEKDGIRTGPVESFLPIAIVALSMSKEIEDPVEAPHKELGKVQDKIPVASSTPAPEPHVVPHEEKRSDVIEDKNDSPQAVIKSELINDDAVENEEHKFAESASEQSAAEPLKTPQTSTVKSASPKHKSIDQSGIEVPKVISDEIKTEVDKHQPSEEPVKENVDKKSPKQISSQDSQEEYFPRSGSPSFYILTSASSADEFVPDQEMSHGQAKSDQPSFEKIASAVSDAFTLVTTIDKPSLQSRKQSPQDDQSGNTTDEISDRHLPGGTASPVSDAFTLIATTEKPSSQSRKQSLQDKQGGIIIGKTSDQRSPEKTASPVSDAFKLIATTEKPSSQFRKQSPQDEHGGIIASEISDQHLPEKNLSPVTDAFTLITSTEKPSLPSRKQSSQDDQSGSITDETSDQRLPERTASPVTDAFTLITTTVKPSLPSRKQSPQDDQSGSMTDETSDQRLPEKNASPVSDAFTLITIVDKPSLQSRKQSPRDEQSDIITGEVRPRPLDLLDMQSPVWDSQQLRIGDISSDSPDNGEPYQTPRHRSKNRTTTVLPSAPEMTAGSSSSQEETAVLPIDQSKLLPAENLKLKGKFEGGLESSDERSSDSTSKLKIHQLTPKMIAEEAIRSGLKEIISDQSGSRKKESSSETSSKTSPESQRTVIPKRKPGKEGRRTWAIVEPKKLPKEKGIAGSQSIKKIENTQEVAGDSIRPKTEPKDGNSHLRETQLVRPRTQRGKAGDSRPPKPQEIPRREARQDPTTRRSKAADKTRNQESQSLGEAKSEDPIKSKPDEGAKEGHMSRYKQKREEMERRRRELREAAEEEQRPRWQRKPTATPPQRVPVKEKSLKKGTPADSKVSESTTPRTRRKIKPLANVESEQLRAMVKEGRKQRKAEGGDSDDPTVEIFATEPPAKVSPDYPPPEHQATSYQYEKIPPPFYLHPPPPPQSSPQVSPLHGVPPDARRPDDDLDSGIAVSLQGGTKLRHQQLLEKKSVFDIAYSEAAPSQLRTDSTTPPS